MGDQTLYEHLQVLLFGFLFGLVNLAFARHLGFFKVPSGESQTPPIRFSNVFAIFAIYLAIQIIAVPLILFTIIVVTLHRWPQLSDLRVDSATQAEITIIGIVLATVALWSYSYYTKPTLLKYIWDGRAPGWSHRAKDALIGFLTMFAAYPTMLFFGQIAAITVQYFFQPTTVEQVAVRHLRGIEEHLGLFWLNVILICTLIPFIEELMFRGYLQTFIKKHLGATKAVLITSFIFALCHFSLSQEMANIELLTSLFALSCFLGYLFERQRSLAASIALHGAFNAFSIVLIILSGEQL